MLSWISSDFFARSPVLIFPVVALCTFMIVFALGSLRALLLDRAQLEALSRLPLEQDDPSAIRRDDEVNHV